VIYLWCLKLTFTQTLKEEDDVFLRVEVTEGGRNHKLEYLVQGLYRVLENAGATFWFLTVAEDVRVSSDRVKPVPRPELSPLPEGNPTSSDPVPPAPVDGTPNSPPIYREPGVRSVVVVGTLQGTLPLRTRLHDVEILGFTPQFLGQGPQARRTQLQGEPWPRHGNETA
jgi:hypothetical protein